MFGPVIGSFDQIKLTIDRSFLRLKMLNLKSHEMSSAIRNDTTTSSNQYDNNSNQSAGYSSSFGTNSNRSTREFDHFGRRISYDNQLDDEESMFRSEKESALNNAKPYYDPIDRKEQSANSMNISRTSDLNRTSESERPEQRSSTSGGFKRTTSYDNFNDFRGPQTTRKTQNEPIKKGLDPYSNPKTKPRRDPNLIRNSEVIVTHSPSSSNNQEGLTSVFARCLFCGKNSVPEKFKGNLDRRGETFI